jgi:hypothetical protein
VRTVSPNAGDGKLTQYSVRCPFSLDRILSLNPGGKVVYRAEKTRCRPFPVPGDRSLRQGVNPPESRTPVGKLTIFHNWRTFMEYDPENHITAR